jgi:hypothetical protein
MNSPHPPRPLPVRTRLWPWIVGPLLLVLVAIVIWSLDEPPPDVGDLEFEPLQLPDNENAFVQLTRVAQRFANLHAGTKIDDEQLDDFIAGKAWDATKAAEWLAPLDPVWPEYEEAVKIPKSQGVIATSPDVLRPEIGQVRALSELSLLRARARLHSNDPDEALRIAFTSLQAGGLFQESRSSLLDYLVGVSLQSRALTLIQDAARHPASSITLLTAALAVLEENRVDPEALRYSLRSELYFYDGAIEMIARDQAGARMVLMVPGIYKPNKTRRIYAEILREAVHAAGSDLAGLDELKRRTEKLSKQMQTRGPENMVGRIILNIITPASGGIVESHTKQASRVSVTQALLAVRIYEKKHGGLPASLAELTPAILPAVPRDYYDNADVKYSREVGFIWSGGRNHLVITSPGQTLDHQDVALRITSEPPKPK